MESPLLASIQVLIADADPESAAVVAYELARRAVRVRTVIAGDAALHMIEDEPPDLVILDLVLPRMSGFQLLQAIRSRMNTQDLAAVVLTERNGRNDRIEAFRLGADDYVTKPFDPEELVLRMMAVLRRVRFAPPLCPGGRIVRAGLLEVDTRSMAVRLDGSEIHFTPLEFKLLAILMEQRGRSVGRPALLEALQIHPKRGARALDMHVQRIRKKLNGSGNQIETLRSFGYRFRTQTPP